MKQLCVFLVCLWLAGCRSAPAPEPAAPAGAETVEITHGPILGRVGSTSVGVWARTSKPADVTVFYGRRPDSINFSRVFTTQQGKDNTGWVLLENLDSGAKYYYEIAVGKRPEGVERLRGHFHTLPSLQDVVHPESNPKGLFNIRFELGGGNDQSADGSVYREALPTFRTMRKSLVRDEEPGLVDFAIQNGDWLYQDDEARAWTPEQWAQEAGARPDRLPVVLTAAPTLAGVWRSYKAALERGAALAEWHRHVPSYFTVGDQEILSDPRGGGDIGLQGWYDYLGWANEAPEGEIVFGRAKLEQGSDVLTSPGANFRTLKTKDATRLQIHRGAEQDGDPNAGVYELVEVLGVDRLRIRPAARATGEASFSIGRKSYWKKRISNVDFYFLDTHTQRDRDGSMLGQEQRDWLKLEMKTSNAAMAFVVSSASLTIPQGRGEGGWTAFEKEREDLIRFWDALSKPVFVLTGGVRNSLAIQVTDNVWEAAAGPHNAANDPSASEGDRPPNGKYDSLGRPVDIRWSTYVRNEIPQELRNRVMYTVVRVNNVFRNETQPGSARWVAYAKPLAVFQYYDGATGELLYAESVSVP